MSDFRKYRVYQRAYALQLDIQTVANAFPTHEKYALTSQLVRAIRTVPATIAEGSGRLTEPDRRNFCITARASLNEVLNHLDLARDLGYISVEIHDKLEQEVMAVRAMLNGLIRKMTDSIDAKKCNEMQQKQESVAVTAEVVPA